MHQMFMYESSGIASLTSVKLSGRTTLGGTVLVVELAIMTQPQKQGEQPSQIVMVGGRMPSVAPLTQALGFWLCVDFAQAHSISLEAYLSNAQIRALDEVRNEKGDIDLLLILEALVNGKNGLKPTSIKHTLHVTRSDWDRVLSEMRFEDRATFEVPVARGRVGPPLDKAAAHLQTALDRVQHRQWVDALKACREVLDELQELQPASVPLNDWADRNKREAWGVAERLVATQTAVRHLTHAGAHTVIGNADEKTVKLAVQMTAALLLYYASR